MHLHKMPVAVKPTAYILILKTEFHDGKLRVKQIEQMDVLVKRGLHSSSQQSKDNPKILHIFL